jgi:hypothetical protein
MLFISLSDCEVIMGGEMKGPHSSLVITSPTPLTPLLLLLVLEVGRLSCIPSRQKAHFAFVAARAPYRSGHNSVHDLGTCGSYVGSGLGPPFFFLPTLEAKRPEPLNFLCHRFFYSF